jgi:hypothetical protein
MKLINYINNSNFIIVFIVKYVLFQNVLTGLKRQFLLNYKSLKRAYSNFSQMFKITNLNNYTYILQFRKITEILLKVALNTINPNENH